jgi:hypothetical protein
MASAISDAERELSELDALFEKKMDEMIKPSAPREDGGQDLERAGRLMTFMSNSMIVDRNIAFVRAILAKEANEFEMKQALITLSTLRDMIDSL